MANYYLKSLGIIHWRLREPENSPVQPLVYALLRENQPCAYLMAQAQNAAETELFGKIAAASGLVVAPVSEDELGTICVPVLVFGSLRFTTKSLISLPALKDLLNSTELKRQVWQVLKGIIAGVYP